MVMETVVGGFQSLKIALDIAKGMRSLSNLGEVQAQAIELRDAILSAQDEAFGSREAQARLISEKRDLEQKLIEFETWDREKQRYQLTRLADGVVAYALKPDAEPPETPHLLCAQCYQKREKGFLQKTQRTERRMWIHQ